MGVKGRDIALYLFFISAALAITGRLINLPVIVFFLAVIITGTMLLYYYVYLFKAKKQSRKAGYKCVVLLPLNCVLVKLLIYLTGKKIKGKYHHAFEIHIEMPAELNLSEFLKMLNGDLSMAKSRLPGSIFVWETSAPVPAEIRWLIKKKEREGKAYWGKGSWLIQKFPFTGRDIKKNMLRKGVIVIE